MPLPARIDARNLVWVVLLAGLCAALGIASALQPTLGLELAIGLAFRSPFSPASTWGWQCSRCSPSWKSSTRAAPS